MLSNDRRNVVLRRKLTRETRFDKIKHECKSWCEKCQEVRWPTGNVNRSQISEGIIEREFECLGHHCTTKKVWVVEKV